ncbi:hypothetical protein [Actinomadura algeriensis]|uniref:Uncharacterized protein n=1 Tax=Actinomadura algeriensis TaxID=1679523 RepID=A0ABR9JN22_9ACTN|nr:hypothetical protein [Actinomadura algeriensis]MBE1531813.1 hypothetical protein [Actinomadura algeriensis]
MHDDHTTTAGLFPAWLDHDPEQVRAALTRRFPGVPSWHGEWTGSWWAMVGDRLLEAACPTTLTNMIHTALSATRPAPHSARPAPSSPAPPPDLRPRLEPHPATHARPRATSRSGTSTAPRPPSRHTSITGAHRRHAAPSHRPAGFLTRLRALLHLPAPAR